MTRTALDTDTHTRRTCQERPRATLHVMPVDNSNFITFLAVLRVGCAKASDLVAPRRAEICNRAALPDLRPSP